MLQYQVTMSLDGFIAGPGGDMSWMTRVLASGWEPPSSSDLAAQVGALLIGRRTHDGDDPNAGTDSAGAYGGSYDGPAIVVTHRLPAARPTGVAFRDDLGAAIREARELAGTKVVSVLGAELARQCWELGELDELLVFIAPVLLGDGTRLFAVPGGQEVPLEVVEAQPWMLRCRVPGARG